MTAGDRRRRVPLPMVAGLSLMALVACEPGPPAEASAASAALSNKASRPRSAEGLCPHGVLEAICPRCHPAVAAVFKAKGDWCEEHAFPESVCPTCHPERGGRPAVDVEGDEAPADGTKISLARADVARLAGLATTRAVSTEAGATVQALVRIRYDGTRQAVVGAPTAGVVKRIAVDVGAEVKRGALLAVIDSVGVGADRSALLAAQARLKAADANLARERSLREEGVSPARDVERAQSERDAAWAAVQGAKAALGVVGATEQGAGAYTLHAPLSGVVTQRFAAMGQSLRAGAEVFEIVDPSRMWADVEVPEHDVGQVRAGQRVTLQFDALPAPLEGKVAFVSPAIDPRTRTALARVPLVNDEGALRANLFGRAKLHVADAQPWVAVPREAVQQAEGQAFVFVKVDPQTFEARRVAVGRVDGERALLKRGLSEGEEVATAGAFLLKTEILRGAIGAGCCE